MTVLPLTAFKDNYIWVLPDLSSQMFDCVDPGDAKPVITYALQSKLTLRTIMLTHHHHDHIGGVNDLVKRFPQTMVYGPDDNRIDPLPSIVKKDDKITLGDNIFLVIETPGHTATHISFYEQNKRWLFCGDTLFSAGCGRVFDGSHNDLYQSLLTYKHLPEETLVYCAHEYTLTNLKFALSIEPENNAAQAYKNKILTNSSSCSLPSTIGIEKKINPFLRLDKQTIKKYAEKYLVDPHDQLAVFTLLRDQKDKF